MKTSINLFLSKYFTLVLLLFSIIGLLLPIKVNNVAFYLLGLLFLIIFSSFFQLDLQWHILKSKLTLSIGYVLVRYIVIPMVLFFAVYYINPFLAAALAYLTILPPGVSSPAVARINQGSMNLALVILLFGNLVVLVSMPILTPYFFKGTAIHPNSLLITLLFTILLPFVTHLPFRKVPAVKQYMHNNLTLIVSVALSIMLMLAISQYRNHLFDNVEIIPLYVLYSLAGFLLLYGVGWSILFFRTKSERISSTFTSGLNNIGLGISLAIIYLPENYILFFIVCEFTWILSLLAVRFMVNRNIGNKSF